MDAGIMARLLEPFAALDQQQLGQISIYIDLLLKWNLRINLTAVRREEDIVTRHFGESLFAAKTLAPHAGDRIIDLGSGAGFPGLPLAIMYPEAEVVLIESNGKKAAFLNEVISRLELNHARVFNQRAEEYGKKADIVTMRAVEDFERSLPLAVSLARGGGRIALMIGERQVSAAEKLAGRVDWGISLAIPGSRSRILAIGIKRVTVEQGA